MIESQGLNLKEIEKYNNAIMRAKKEDDFDHKGALILTYTFAGDLLPSQMDIELVRYLLRYYRFYGSNKEINKLQSWLKSALHNKPVKKLKFDVTIDMHDHDGSSGAYSKLRKIAHGILLTTTVLVDTDKQKFKRI